MTNLRDEEKTLPLTGLYCQILTALAGRTLYGYAIAQACRHDSGGVMDPGFGAIYAALGRLERMNYIRRTDKVAGNGSTYQRQMYEITSTGRAVLGWEADRLVRVAHLARKRLAQ